MQKRKWIHTLACLAMVRVLVLNAYAQDAVMPSRPCRLQPPNPRRLAKPSRNPRRVRL